MSGRSTRGRCAAWIALGVMSVGFVACGDDDADTAGPTDTTAAGPTDNTAAGPTDNTEAASPASDEPVRIMNITTLSGTSGQDTPEAAAAIAAGVAALNDRGGIGGRQVELVQCDDKGDPNEATQCARDAVSGGIVATVGDASGQRESYIGVLEEAGIPVVGAFPSTPSDYTSVVSFPVVGGVPSLFTGVGRQLLAVGASTVSSVLIDFPQVSALSSLLDRGLAAEGAEVASETLVPVGAPDLQGAVAASTGGRTDGVALLLLVGDNVRYIQEARSSGYAGDIAVADLSTEAIGQLGESANGILITGFFQPLSAGGSLIERYEAEMAAHAPDAPLEKLGAVNAWVALQVLDEALADTDVNSPADVTAALETVSDLDLGGFIPPLSFDEPFFEPEFARLFNRSVWFLVVEDGEIVLAEPEPIDPFSS